MTTPAQKVANRSHSHNDVRSTGWGRRMRMGRIRRMTSGSDAAGPAAAGPGAGAASAASGKLQAEQLVLPAGLSVPQSGQLTVSDMPSSSRPARGRATARPRDYRQPRAHAASAPALDPRFEPMLASPHSMRLRPAVLVALLALWCLAPPRNAAAETARVTLLHTTDLHGALTDYDYANDRLSARGLVRIATMVRGD